MKNVLKKPKKNGPKRSSPGDEPEFLEAVEDYHSNDESPEDHCSDQEESTPVFHERT
jgi:hypothetical protein